MAKLRVCERNGKQGRLELSRSLGCGRGPLFMGTRKGRGGSKAVGNLKDERKKKKVTPLPKKRL